MSHNLTRDEKRRLGLSTGCPPVGYVNHRYTDSKCSVAVLDLIRAPLVTAVFAYAAENSVPLTELCRYAKQIGLTSRTGGTIGVSAMWSILTNSFYVGKVGIGDKLVDGRHSPIVDVKTFKAVQKAFKNRRFSVN